MRSHPNCWTGEGYAHTCSAPSGRRCLDCDQPAGTLWGPLWCPGCDVVRLDRCSAGLAEIAAAIADKVSRLCVDDETSVVNIVGGTPTDPGDTELDDAIEQIVGDYIPDSLLRVQVAQRILTEVVKRTGLDVYANPSLPIPTPTRKEGS